jgi:hypothetical protein
VNDVTRKGPVYIVSLKALGDSLIPMIVANSMGVYSQNYLVPSLARTLISDMFSHFSGISYVETTGRNAPPYFDLRYSGPIRAIKSYFSLRSALRRISDSNINVTFMVHKPRWKDKLLFLGFKWEIIGSGDNIYVDYCRFYTSRYGKMLRCVDGVDEIGPKCSTISILPSAGLVEKNIPIDVIELVRRSLRSESGYAERNICVYVTPYLSVGSGMDAYEIFPEDVAISYIDNFAQLIAVIKRSDLLVVADSLSAHLCEHFRKKFVVLTPDINYYWLPLSCFLSSATLTFKIIRRYPSSLDRLLRTFQPSVPL